MTTPRLDKPKQADEVTTALAFLDFQRATVLAKAEGLDAAELAQFGFDRHAGGVGNLRGLGDQLDILFVGAVGVGRLVRRRGLGLALGGR